MVKSLLSVLLLSFAALGARAGDTPRSTPAAQVSETDARAVRAVVAAQLKALAADDADRAFSQASPAIQRRFHDAATFAQMVRLAYPMLIRPAGVSFYRPVAGDSVITQSVLFRDEAGHMWRADYLLQRQPDRHWRIEGCEVVPSDATSTT